MAYEPDPEYDRAGGHRDRYDPPQPTSRLGRTTIIAVGIVLALVVIVFAYRAGVREGGGEGPPLITADPSPIKVPPESPGGMEVPNQDALILNQQPGQATTEAEQLLPPAEQPLPPPAEAPLDADATSTLPETPPAAAAPVPGAGAPVDGASATAPPTSGVPAAPAPVTAQPAQPSATAAVAPPPPAALTPAPAAAGGAAVQFAALKDRAAADQAWARLQKLHGDLIGGLRPSIEAVSVNGSTLYRLRGIGLADKSAAAALCAKLKTRKQDCTVVR